MRRTLFEAEHEDFRDSFRTFCEREVAPQPRRVGARRDRAPRAVRQGGAHGFLGIAVPEEHGGAGIDDFRFNLVIGEETPAHRGSGAGLGLTLHNDIVTALLPRVLRRAISASAGCRGSPPAS